MKNTEVKRLVYQGDFAFNEGIKVGKKETIEKAVEWLQKYFVEDHYGMSPSGFCVFADMFIKAMEE